MFGYIVVHQPELKCREYDAYKAGYCGLCHSLKKRHGRLGQLTLSFDMTFLAFLLTGLYEPETKSGHGRCLAHPMTRHAYRSNPYYDYAADMNVLLTYYKCMDDWADERKLSRFLLAKLLYPGIRKLEKTHARQAKVMKEKLLELSAMEREGSLDIDRSAGYFGAIMAELFVCQEDQWAERLRRMGFYFGKFIYLMDAYEDIEEDIKKHRYNPLIDLYQKESFEEDAALILKMMMAETAAAFEQLPILQDVEILRNILYAGVWSRYGQVYRSRKEAKENA